MKPYTRKAQYYETDQMGVVHHSNYIRWFEETRTDMMDQMGYPYARLEAEGIISPVIGVECQYKASVRFNDLVDITATLTHFNGVKMSVTYQVLDHETGELRAYGATHHCYLNKAGRPVSLKKANPAAYAVFMAMTEE